MLHVTETFWAVLTQQVAATACDCCQLPVRTSSCYVWVAWGSLAGAKLPQHKSARTAGSCRGPYRHLHMMVPNKEQP